MSTYPVDLKPYEVDILGTAIVREVTLIMDHNLVIVDNNDERYELERDEQILKEAFDIIAPFVDNELRNSINYPPIAQPPNNQSNREGYIRVTFIDEQIDLVIEAVEKYMKDLERIKRIYIEENDDENKLALLKRKIKNTIRLLDKLRALAPYSGRSSAPAGSSAPNTESSASFPAARPHTNRRATRKSRKNRKNRKSRKNRKASRRS